jgi:hypothetical protein
VVVAAAAGSGLALATRTSSAQTADAGEAADCSGARPWVLLTGGMPKPLASAVRSELRAGLISSHIDVCAEGAGPAGRPLARVSFTPVGEGTTRYSLDVTDSVTQKRVGRDLSLEKLPADGRALALAVAAEELLRASWAELALRGVHSPDTAPPPEVRAVVERTRPAPASPSRGAALGARLAFEHFLGGQTHFGGDAVLLLPLGSLTGASVALGGRRALSEQAPHGSIGARALAAELGLSLRLVQRPGLKLEAGVSGRALWLTFEPSSAGTAQASTQSGLGVIARAGLSLVFGGRLKSFASLGAGLPLRSFAASDSGAEVTGVSSLELFAATGLALQLP